MMAFFLEAHPTFERNKSSIHKVDYTLSRINIKAVTIVTL